MAAELGGIDRAFLSSVYESKAREALNKESATLRRLLEGGPPRRAAHLEEPSAEQVAKFDAWKKRFTEAYDEGYANDWLEWDYDEDSRPVASCPKQLVYDETEDEHQARLAEWQAAVAAEQPKYVTIPVVSRNSVQAEDPTEDEGRVWTS